MGTSPSFSARPLTPHQAASKGAIKATSIRAEVSSVISQSRSTLKRNREVSLYDLKVLGCLIFNGYSSGKAVLTYNTCNFTLYQRELDKRHYFMEEIVKLSGDFEEESNNTRGM